MTFLIVHQNAAIRRILSRVVEMVGIPNVQFLEAESGQKALKVLKRVDELNCIFIEVCTSKMHSADFIHSVTNLPENKRWATTPIFVVDVEGNHVAQAITARGRGAKGYIRKPFMVADIKELLEGVGLIQLEN